MTRVVLVGWAAAAAVMVALWWRQERTRNATSVDAAWSLAIAALVVLYAATIEAPVARRVLVGGMGGAWALRLGLYLLRDRVLRHTEEDGRYRALRERWGQRSGPYFFVFYQAQAAVAVLFSLPILAAMRGGALDGWAALGAVVWAIAVAGEALADRQLARFRADPANKGDVCRVGLWRYSRHPNYFFEWVHWWAYVAVGHGAALTWLGPALMLAFLYRFTGIPYTERQAVKSRGERYREYQRTTSAFIPWFPRRASP